MAALESHALARGRRFDAVEARDQPLDEAWWRAAATRREVAPPPYGIEAGYGGDGEQIAWAVEDLLKFRLHLQEWLDLGKRAPMELALVPFRFSDGARGEPPWAEIGSAESRLLIGEGDGFVTYWEGGYADDDGRAYRARAEAAREALGARKLAPDADVAAEQIALAIESTFYDLILAAWNRGLLVSVSF